MSELRAQANAFAKKYGVSLKVLGEDYRPYFPNDRESRSVYKLRLFRKGKSYTFNFGQSIMNAGVEPDLYDVLACLTKYDPYSLENFASEYGYDLYEDYRQTKKIYNAVVKEYTAVMRLFGDDPEALEALRDIC